MLFKRKKEDGLEIFCLNEKKKMDYKMCCSNVFFATFCFYVQVHRAGLQRNRRNTQRAQDSGEQALLYREAREVRPNAYAYAD